MKGIEYKNYFNSNIIFIKFYFKFKLLTLLNLLKLICEECFHWHRGFILRAEIKTLRNSLEPDKMTSEQKHQLN